MGQTSPELQRYLSTLDWQKNELEKIHDTPIILRGFYNKADGIGAIAPNLYDKVFKYYKNVSLITQKNRGHLHFADITSIQLNMGCVQEFKKHGKSFGWNLKWKSLEGEHLKRPKDFQNAKFIHAGGFDNIHNFEIEYQQNYLDIFKLKKLFNVETYLYLMWESTGIEIFEKLFHLYDHIIVTNTWLQKLIQDKYPQVSVLFVEHVASYYTQYATGAGKNFTFGFSGGLWERKKADIVVRAFNQIKTSTDTLKIHSRQFVNTPKMIEIVSKEIKKSPNGIEFKNKTLPDKEFAEWWDSLNCYVFVSAGEGYSITPRQALMQGTPVILSKNTSHLDLLDVPGILWVECDPGESEWSGAPDMHISAGQQYEPRLGEVVKQMKEIKDNYDFWKKAAFEGGEIIKNRTNDTNIQKQWSAIL